MSFARRVTTVGLTLAMIGGIAPFAFADGHLAWERNVKTVKKMYEIFTQGDVADLDTVFAADFVAHDAPEGENGVEEMKQMAMMYRTGFSDAKADVQRIIAEGDYVGAFFFGVGTNDGEFAGMPATGKKVMMPVIEIWKLKDGKVAEGWGAPDRIAMMTQLGMMPPMGPAPNYEGMAAAIRAEGDGGGSVEANKKIAMRVMDEVWAGKIAVVDEIYAEDYTTHSMAMPGMSARDALKANVESWHAGISNADGGTSAIVAQGDLVATAWWATGTHTGDFMGVPATNKDVKIVGATIFRVRDGKIVEDWTVADMMGFMQQLGMMPGM